MEQGLQQGRRIWKGWSYPSVGRPPSAAIFRQIVSSRTWTRWVYSGGVEGAAPQRFLSTINEVDEKGDKEGTSV